MRVSTVIKKMILGGALGTMVLGMSLLSNAETTNAPLEKDMSNIVCMADENVSDPVLDALLAYRAELVKTKASKKTIKEADTIIEAYKLQKGIPTDTSANSDKASKEKQNTPAPAPVNTTGTGIIFIGDSRTVQMHEALGETGALYVAENGKGYDWLVSVGIPNADPCVIKGAKVVINLGVNDPGNVHNYISTVNYWASVWNQRGAKVYYATVNPVSENPYTSTEQVNYFNDELVKGLVGVNIIDTNYYLKSTGYNLVDGLHYNGPTYLNIYSYILSCL